MLKEGQNKWCIVFRKIKTMVTMSPNIIKMKKEPYPVTPESTWYIIYYRLYSINFILFLFSGHFTQGNRRCADHEEKEVASRQNKENILGF